MFGIRHEFSAIIMGSVVFLAISSCVITGCAIVL